MQTKPTQLKEIAAEQFDGHGQPARAAEWMLIRACGRICCMQSNL